MMMCRKVEYSNNILREIEILTNEYSKRYSLAHSHLYMNMRTFWEFRNQMSSRVYRDVDFYHRVNGSHGRVFGLDIRIDNSIDDFTFVIRETRDLARDLNDHVLDASIYFNFDVDRINDLRLPQHYIINNGATILFWDDGTKTIVKRAKDDTFDPVKSFLWAYFQKHSGLSKTKANKYLRKLDKEHEPVITIKGNIDPGLFTFTGVFTEEK